MRYFCYNEYREHPSTDSFEDWLYDWIIVNWARESKNA